MACPRQALFGMHQRLNSLLDSLFNQYNPNGPAAPHPHTPAVIPNRYAALPNPYPTTNACYAAAPPAAYPYAAYPYAAYPYAAWRAAVQPQLQPGGVGGAYRSTAPRRPRKKENRGGHQR
jgi:hypothetical protein